MAYTRVTLRDGTALNVYDSGAEGVLPPLLFVHGNSCDHTFLTPQIEHFQKTRRVIAPDLRGHGESDAPQEGYAFAELAEDLAEMLNGLEGMEGRAVTAVGHSMGGVVVLELAHHHPELVAGVACLDSTVLSPPGRPSRIHSLLDGLRSTAWQGYFLRYFEAAFDPVDDPQRKQAILERMLRTPQHVIVALFEQWRIADGAAAARACRAPMLYVSSSRPRTDTAQLAELCPQLMHGQAVGSGHFLTLEVPAQVNAMLERFLEINGL
ncbi:alpha/beta fold hydrolase [Fundidesulfovibrio agrisoli]|uniref:alpha/beta fold hydrolase n=1 Tax=Fundidesulfovibrio agrisoli TaxID=2922717 RepID=UPI001FACA868|nr:alpha/beta hydrolase [Fundidesulfovibrio agrisoli]